MREMREHLEGSALVVNSPAGMVWYYGSLRVIDVLVWSLVSGRRTDVHWWEVCN